MTSTEPRRLRVPAKATNRMPSDDLGKHARWAATGELKRLREQLPVWHAAHAALHDVLTQQASSRFVVIRVIPKKAWKYLQYGLLHNDGYEIALAWAWATYYVCALSHSGDRGLRIIAENSVEYAPRNTPPPDYDSNDEYARRISRMCSNLHDLYHDIGSSEQCPASDKPWWPMVMLRSDAREWIDDEAEKVRDTVPSRVLMLSCPSCKNPHIDRDEWKTRPHRVHKCRFCDNEWMPAQYNTVGVTWDEYADHYNCRDTVAARHHDEPEIEK